MNDFLPEGLLELLACPECGGVMRCQTVRTDGGEDPFRLECGDCERHFTAPGGIPVLYPDDIDLDHLAEEEKLGELMESHVPSGREIFHKEQWEASKNEFWKSVRKKLGPGPGRKILNAGCGIDTHFLGLAGEEDTLVAFDMMLPLLETLRDRHGSRLNVAGVVQSLPFREGAFDCLCCIDLIHHEPDLLEEILRSFYRLLRPGGILMLEDINAWGIFQFWKSILLPRPIHGTLRSIYHRMRGSDHQPAAYEFPTSVHKVRRLLAGVGFRKIEAIPQLAYPNTSRAGASLYRSLARCDRIARHHNFHYLLYAEKAHEQSTLSP